MQFECRTAGCSTQQDRRRRMMAQPKPTDVCQMWQTDGQTDRRMVTVTQAKTHLKDSFCFTPAVNEMMFMPRWLVS